MQRIIYPKSDLMSYVVDFLDPKSFYNFRHVFACVNESMYWKSKSPVDLFNFGAKEKFEYLCNEAISRGITNDQIEVEIRYNIFDWGVPHLVDFVYSGGYDNEAILVPGRLSILENLITQSRWVPDNIQDWYSLFDPMPLYPSWGNSMICNPCKVASQSVQINMIKTLADNKLIIPEHVIRFAYQVAEPDIVSTLLYYSPSMINYLYLRGGPEYIAKLFKFCPNIVLDFLYQGTDIAQFDKFKECYYALVHELSDPADRIILDKSLIRYYRKWKHINHPTIEFIKMITDIHEDQTWMLLVVVLIILSVTVSYYIINLNYNNGYKHVRY